MRSFVYLPIKKYKVQRSDIFPSHFKRIASELQREENKFDETDACKFLPH
jgi:hypothetical protein